MGIRLPRLNRLAHVLQKAQVRNYRLSLKTKGFLRKSFNKTDVYSKNAERGPVAQHG